LEGDWSLTEGAPVHVDGAEEASPDALPLGARTGEVGELGV
jgi:hypothetical protein